MKLKRRLKQTANAMLAVAMIAALSHPTGAQETRPRYNSARSAEQSWTLPPDTVINVQMNGTLSSRTARVGDKFTATVTVPVYVNGRTVIPAGSIIEGRVTQVTPAKRMNRSGTIGVDFDDLLFPSGARVGLVGSLTSDDPETRRRIDDESRVSGEGNKRPSVFIGGGAVIGAVLGGITGGGEGAVLGGVAGAGAGVAGVLLSKGEEAQVPSGTPFGVQIKQALIIRESFISEGAPAADRSADQPADRPERPDVVGSQPDNPDRPLAGRAEPEMRPEVDRSTAGATELPLSSPEMVRKAQGALKEQGYYEGEVDGVMSPRTSGALRAYQREHNLQETGDLDPQTAKRLGIVSGAGIERTPDRRRETRTEKRGDARMEPSAPPAIATSSASSLQRKAEELLSEYQRVYGVRITGTGVEVDNAAQYQEAEIELLFAIDSFANAAQLYARLATSLRDRQSMRGATLAMARQARRTDRAISTTTSRAADSLAARWDLVRQDVLKLMQTYSISSSEVEN